MLYFFVLVLEPVVVWWPGACSDAPGAAGIVALFSPSVPGHTEVHFGELVFSVDR